MAGCVQELQAMKESQVAAALQVSVRTLQNWRVEKRGPRFVKVGYCVRYRLKDVESWLREQGR